MCCYIVLHSSSSRVVGDAAAAAVTSYINPPKKPSIKSVMRGRCIFMIVAHQSWLLKK